MDLGTLERNVRLQATHSRSMITRHSINDIPRHLGLKEVSKQK